VSADDKTGGSVGADGGPERAREIYAVARPGYHPVTTNSVDAVVGRP